MQTQDTIEWMKLNQKKLSHLSYQVFNKYYIYYIKSVEINENSKHLYMW